MLSLLPGIIMLAILPKGTVRDEASFLILVVLLFALVGVAWILRRRRNAEDEGENEEGGAKGEEKTGGKGH